MTTLSAKEINVTSPSLPSLFPNSATKVNAQTTGFEVDLVLQLVWEAVTGSLDQAGKLAAR